MRSEHSTAEMTFTRFSDGQWLLRLRHLTPAGDEVVEDCVDIDDATFALMLGMRPVLGLFKSRPVAAKVESYQGPPV